MSPALAKRIVTRLLANITLAECRILDTPCWLWNLSTCNKGYAQFTYCVEGQKTWKRAHIVLWELVTGKKVRDGYTLDHRCLRTHCIRPEHMDEVPRAVNTARGNRTRHGRAATSETRAEN